MKTTVKIVVLTAVLSSFALAGQAMADTLGNTLANHLCGGRSTTYRLSSAELAQWTGLDVHGAYSVNASGTTTSYYFNKTRNDDDAAICNKSIKTSSGTQCQQWHVTKSGNVLTEGTASSRCN